MKKTYRAFISYNRGADASIASALATSLTRFARPWYRTRAMRVFLDKNSMGTSAALSKAIERGLAQSEWLVLLARPESAASPWVGHELAWWLAHRPLSRLIIARTGGVIQWDRAAGADFDWNASTALSPALRGAYREEPLWADLEAAAAARLKSVDDPVFRDAFLNIAAQIHGQSKDELWNAERGEQRKRIVAVAGAAVVLAAVGAVGYNQWQVSLDRKENLASIQLGAKAFSLLPAQPLLAAQVALAGVAMRPSGIAASALRSATAQLAGAAAPRWTLAVAGARGIAYSADATRLAVLLADGGVRVLDVADGRVLNESASMQGFDASTIVSSADGLLAIGGTSGLRLMSGATLGVVERTLPAIRALAFSNDGKRLAIAHADGRARIVDAAGVEVTAAFAAHTGSTVAIAYSADGAHVATAGTQRDGPGSEVAVWEVATSKNVLRVSLANPVVSLDFNVEGGSTLSNRLLAVTDSAGAVHLFDAEFSGSANGPPAGAPRAITLPSSRGAAVASRFVRSGRCLVRASADALVEVDTTLGFDRLFELARTSDGAARSPDSIIALSVAKTSHYATLDAHGRVAVYEQPLCGDAEAVCAYADAWLPSPMSTQDRWRWVPADADLSTSVQQPPGPACRRLIDRVLRQPSPDISTIPR